MKSSRRSFLKGAMMSAFYGTVGLGLTNSSQAKQVSNSSALQHRNDRRTIIRIRKNLTECLRGYIFEPNDKRTRKNICGNINVYFQQLACQRLIQKDYKVVCDENNNTPSLIDIGGCRVDAFLKLPKAQWPTHVSVTIGKED